MKIDRATLARLWPNAPASLVNAIASESSSVFEQYDINNWLRLVHFMAQISHESDGGTIREENMNYTTAARIAAVWPSRFTVQSAQPYVRNPRKLANKVYNGRMGNAAGSDDGYNYRGRGLLQITGKESYEEIGELTGLDLVNDPSLINEPSHALTVAACEFKKLKCLPAADEDDIRAVTKRVNGGYIGLDSRKEWLAKWKLAIPEEEAQIEPEEEIHLPRTADSGSVSETITSVADTAKTVVTTAKPLFKSRISVAAATMGAGNVVVAATQAPPTLWEQFINIWKSPVWWLVIINVCLTGYIIYHYWRDHGRGALQRKDNV